MEKQDDHRNLKAEIFGRCAWCSDPLQRDEYFTVTFPDKDQAMFHVKCLYRYRELMSPQTSR